MVRSRSSVIIDITQIYHDTGREGGGREGEGREVGQHYLPARADSRRIQVRSACPTVPESNSHSGWARPYRPAVRAVLWWFIGNIDSPDSWRCKRNRDNRRRELAVRGVERGGEWGTYSTGDKTVNRTCVSEGKGYPSPHGIASKVIENNTTLPYRCDKCAINNKGRG